MVSNFNFFDFSNSTVEGIEEGSLEFTTGLIMEQIKKARTKWVLESSYPKM